MGADSPDVSGSPTDRAAERPSRAEPPTVGLRSIVVSDDVGPDRRTLYPADADDAERMTHWLSADDVAFVRLDEHR